MESSLEIPALSEILLENVLVIVQKAVATYITAPCAVPFPQMSGQ